MTPGEQRRKALELLAPPPSRRHECLRDIEYALDWVSGPARTAFKIFGSKEGRAGLRRYANALRRALAAYQNLHPRIRPWFSITETAYIVGQPTHLHREIAKAEAILDRPSSSSRAAQHKAAVAMAYNLLSWHGYRATTNSWPEVGAVGGHSNRRSEGGSVRSFACVQASSRPYGREAPGGARNPLLD